MNLPSQNGVRDYGGGRQSYVAPRQPALFLEATIDLLARVQTGDQSAWDVLINRYLHPLKRLGHGRLRGHARSMSDTDDLVQDALVRTIKRLPQFDCRNRGALLAYLRRVLLNGIVDEARTCARRGTAVVLTDDCAEKGPSPLERVLTKEETVRYQAALRRLKPRDRQLIVLRVEQRLKYRELATQLCMASPNAARIALRRAVARLASALKHV